MIPINALAMEGPRVPVRLLHLGSSTRVHPYMRIARSMRRMGLSGAKLQAPGLWLCVATIGCVVAWASTANAQTTRANQDASLIEDRMETLFGESQAETPDLPEDPAAPTTDQDLIADTQVGPADSEPLPIPDDLPLGANNADSGKLGQFLSNGQNRNLPSNDDAKGKGHWLLNTLAALGVVIGLILLLKWGFNRMTGGRGRIAGSRAVEVLSRTTVAPRNHVLLLRVGRRVLVVNDSTHGMRTLSDIEDAEEVADLLQTVETAKADSASNSFQGLLSRLTDRHEDGHDPAIEGHDDDEKDLDRARDHLSHLLSRIRHVGSGSSAGKEMR